MGGVEWGCNSIWVLGVGNIGVSVWSGALQVEGSSAKADRMVIRPFSEIYPRGISPDEALAVLRVSEAEFFEAVVPLTRRMREASFGNKISFCSIVNAKSGACPEVCSFCSQSAAYKEAEAPLYPLMTSDEIVSRAKQAETAGATEFSIVTSGRALTKARELDVLTEAISRISAETEVESCASLGLMDAAGLKRLRDAGMVNYHHNIETAPSFFPEIVKTHSFQDEVAAIRAAKAVGLKVCSGGILGMGESLEQRVEFVFTLKTLEVDSIPLNFLNPRPGTPLEGLHELTPLDCLKAIAITRLAMPTTEIFVCGGREVNLGPYLDRVYDAGASGTMIGNYLTTAGRDPSNELALIRRLGLEPVSPHSSPSPL